MATREALEAHLRSMILYSSTLNLEQPKQCKKSLEQQYSLENPFIQEVFRLAQSGINEGWICHKSNGNIRFSRVIKPEENEKRYAVDAVMMNGPGPKHTHPLGEIDLCFALEGTPKFDGNPPGWTIYPPKSTHIPTVIEGKMLILYFLPEGQITFHKD
ncbi:MAG: DUF4863 family protein [Planctomycetota bacterium]